MMAWQNCTLSAALLASLALACSEGTTAPAPLDSSEPGLEGQDSAQAATGGAAAASDVATPEAGGSAVGPTSAGGDPEPEPTTDMGSLTGDAGMTDTSSAAEVMGEPSTGTLPPVDDYTAPGPFTPTITDGVGPGGTFRFYHPEELGQDGVLHPVVLFAAGGGFVDNYNTLLNRLASHGFVVLAHQTTPYSGQLTVGLDWLIDEAVSAPPWEGKLDTDHVAASGQSFGSLITFQMAADPRLTTTVHLQGGTMDAHMELFNLRNPAIFLCGESPKDGEDGTFAGDMSNEHCAEDFELAEVPVFYGSLTGAAHIQTTESVADPNDPLRNQMIGAMVGWLRWQLAGDESARADYVGDDCGLCQPETGWVVKQRGLE